MTRVLWSRLVVLVAVGFLVYSATNKPLAAQAPSRYYYFQGQKISLELNPRLIAVSFAPDFAIDAQRATVNAVGDLDFDAGVPSPVGGVRFIPLRPSASPLEVIGRLHARPGVQAVSPVYDFGATQLAETTEFLAKFKPELSAEQIAQINRANGVEIQRRLAYSDGVLVLKPQAGNPRSARELANAYVEGGWVSFAEPNFVVRVLARTAHPGRTGESAPPKPGEAGAAPDAAELTPNDTHFGRQWGLKNTGQFLGAQPGADTRAPRAWNVTQGASSLKIAILDEGVDASHPDLQGKVLTGYNATDGSTNTTPNARERHGTEVAGVAAANSNNARGVAGVCWFCQILPVKIANRDPQGNWVTTDAILASGIDWAWQNGADVLNNSWTMTAPSGAVTLAIANAWGAGRGGKGSTVIFSSGNQDASVVSFPASLNNYVIAVGASNWCDQRKAAIVNACNNDDASWGSNYGTALDLLAPGQAVFTTCNGNDCTNGNPNNNDDYTYDSGTSFAAPHVSGAAALLYSLNPNLTPEKVQRALQNGATDLGPAGRDDETGHGRLNLYRSLAQLFNLTLTVSDGRSLVRPGENITYTLSYANPGLTAMSDTELSVTLPAGANYVSSTPAFTHEGGGIYTLALGTLASGATGTASFRAQAQMGSAGQTLTLTANISGKYPESDSSDNSAQDVTGVIIQDIFLPLLFRRY